MSFESQQKTTKSSEGWDRENEVGRETEPTKGFMLFILYYTD